MTAPRTPMLRRVLRGAQGALLLAALVGGDAAATNGPVLSVSLNGSFPYVFLPGSPPVMLPVAPAQSIHLTWWALPGDAGEPIEAFRFGWDIRNPADDEEWQHPWCADCVSEVRAFSTGTHRFFLEARDHAGLVTGAQFELVVTPVGIATASWSQIKVLMGR